MDSKGGEFSALEYRRRTLRAQELMSERKIDTLFLMTEAEIRYFSGFFTRFWESPTRPYFLIIPIQGKPVAIIPTIGKSLMSTTWLDDIRTWSAPFPQDDGVTLVIDALRDFSTVNRRIGIPMGHETRLRMPLNDFNKIRSQLSEVDFVDATVIVREVCQIKTEAEISRIAHTCDIGSRTFNSINTIAVLGKPLTEVFRDFQITLLKNGADWVPYLAGGAGKGGYGDIISLPTKRPLEQGDVLMLDTGAICDGYFCDFDRNYAIKSVDSDVSRMYSTLHEAIDAGLNCARPGVTCADLYHAMNKVIVKNEKPDINSSTGRFGHGLGMRLTEWPSLTPTDQTVLEPGMVLTLEPSLETVDGRMMVHEENIVIRDTGCQLLTTRATPFIPVLEG